MAADKKPSGDKAVTLHTAEKRTQVIELYQAGHKLADITSETGVPRATIYWILRQEGVRTDRVARSPDDALSMSELLDQLRRSEQETGRLRADLERERTITRWFVERIVFSEELPTELKQVLRQQPARPRKRTT